MALTDLALLVDRLVEVADTLRMRSNQDPFNDDLDDLASEVQSIAEDMQREIE